MSALAEAFADVFVARDGDATMADVAAVFAVIALMVVAYWLVRRKRRRDWTQWRERHEERVIANSERVTSLCDCILRDYGTGPPQPERHLKVVKGA